MIHCLPRVILIREIRFSFIVTFETGDKIGHKLMYDVPLIINKTVMFKTLFIHVVSFLILFAFDLTFYLRVVN